MKIALANYVDLIRAENGDIPSDSVRRFEVDGIVDTGAAQLVLPASAAAAKPAPAAVPSGPSLPGVPLYPTAEYLETVDAGSGQHYYLYGTDVPFADIVSYYRTVMKNGGREIYRTPAMHQFDLGRFNEERMVYPPSVVVKDYSGTTTPGYLHVVGTTEKRFRTVIQIVPAAPQ